MIGEQHDVIRASSDAVYVRTRTGKKVHRGWVGSSVTGCGVWLKTSGSSMEIPERFVLKAVDGMIRNPSSLGPATLVLCQNCFSPHFDPQARHDGEGSSLAGYSLGGSV